MWKAVRRRNRIRFVSRTWSPFLQSARSAVSEVVVRAAIRWADVARTASCGVAGRSGRRLAREDAINGQWPSGGRLVGRAAELSVWEAVLGRAVPPQQVIAVAGDPGMGKTRLLDEFRRRAGRAGVPVLTMRALETDGASSFSTLSGALDSSFPRCRRTAAFMHGDGSPAAGVAALRLAISDVQTSAGDRSRVHAVARRLLERSSRDRGFVLILDDVHWADDDTTTLLLQLARASLPRRAVICLAYRPRQSSQRFVTEIAELSRIAVVRQLQLEALSERDSRRFLGPDFAVGDVRSLQTQSGGNPQYLEALAHRSSFEDSNELLRFAAELETVTPAVRTVARAAAVLGAEFDPGYLPRIVSLKPGEVSESLDELARRDLIRASKTGGLLSFRHALVREAIYASAGPGWRRTAHAMSAEVLRCAGATAAARAEHVENYAGNGDVEAIAVLLRAASTARWQDPRSAVRWYRAAARLLSDEQQRGRRLARLAVAEAEALLAAGDFSRSWQMFAKVLEDVQSRSSATRIKAITGLAKAARYIKRDQQATAIIEQETAWFLPSTPGPARWLWLELAADRIDRGEVGAGRSVLELLVEVRKDGHDEAAWRAGVLALKALAAASDGEVEQGLVDADVAGRVVDAWSETELAANLRTVLWIVRVDMLGSRYADALHRLRRAVTTARQSGQLGLLAELLVVEGSVLLKSGILSAARLCFTEVREVAEGCCSESLLLSALAGLSRVSVWRRELAEARSLAKTADELLNFDQTPTSILASGMLGEVSLVLGDPTLCVARVLAAGGGPDLVRATPSTRVAWYELLTRAELVRGDFSSARTWADRATSAASTASQDRARAFAALAESQVWLGFGRCGVAIESARTAVQGFDAATDPLELARAHVVLGRALASTRSNEAIVELREAMRIFTSCGARSGQEEVSSELRRLGVWTAVVESGRQAGGSEELLSCREREVAELVAHGLTNKEIAAAMFLSEKTIERHMTSILSKLGVRSRAAVVMKLHGTHDPEVAGHLSQ
ncbi:AAA family ATPase [Kribbella sp. NPDC023855]|uniref:helix-turn-helix transcriptional regulator n=1 Tax=Kribbella sp. NPDC023855 TaxID=3154698 RepID=UPI0033F9FC08